ncbi:MAG: hypothetical protein WD603_01315 [Patescibacteria group bacterium]
MDWLVRLTKFTLRNDRRRQEMAYAVLERDLEKHRHGWTCLFYGCSRKREELKKTRQIVEKIDVALRALDRGDFAPAARQLESLAAIAVLEENTPSSIQLLLTEMAKGLRTERITADS